MQLRRRQSQGRRSLLSLPKRNPEKETPFWKGLLIAAGIALVISVGVALVTGSNSDIRVAMISVGVGMLFAMVIWALVTLADKLARHYKERLGPRMIWAARGTAWLVGGILGWMVAYEAMALIMTGALAPFNDVILRLLLTSIIIAFAIGGLITLVKAGARRVRRETQFLQQRDLLTSELETARNVQRTLLPTEDARLYGFDISGATAPAVEIGGDYYDYLSFADGTKGILVADAAGKGIPAALVMAKFQGMAQALSIHVADPHEFFIGLNDTLRVRLDRRSFITAGMMTVDFEDNCAFYRAGHNPLYCYRAETGTIEQLKPTGLGLGLTHGSALGASIVPARFAMKPGDVALLYSDGLNEATDTDGNAYGDERVAESLCRAASGRSGALEVKNQILKDLTTFVGDAEPHDDVTVVVVKKL